MRALLNGLVAAGMAGLGTCRGDEAGLDIYFIDVQGGAATLLVTPEKESVLIDSGWPGFDDRDPKRIAFVLQKVAGLDHLDHLITTHWHMDHFGGVERLTKRLEIRHFWDRGLPEDGIADLDFPDGPKADDPLGIAYRKASAGKRKPLGGSAMPVLKGAIRSELLCSGGRVMGAAGPHNSLCDDPPADLDPDPSDNARCIGLHFWYKDFDFLDLGDLTWNVEKRLVCPVSTIGKIDLYQVTHHGMDISNHPTLLKTIIPTVAIMNNGPRKGGSPETFKRLRALPSVEALYALHKNEESAPEENADPAFTANADPDGGQFIQVHVEPDGKHFIVRIGIDGTPRTFASR
jgi:beta-lactamase superfamily II metal-dependent hydrolase